ncbi:ASST-domain-containing protein [Leptodontidium sp. MPI-SDFR-AT-0119]|nr:ASST-domain-containing protein [Leptodontidium sp. MPI-SDFR-AT-0119]
MPPYKLLAFLGLGIVFHVPVTLADLGPYFRSISYEHAGHGKWPHQSYHSSDVIGPILNVQRYDDSCDNGQYIFLSIIGSEVSFAGPAILDELGNLVWASPYGRTSGTDVQMLDGQPYLTFCSWPEMGSNVTCHMLNTEYEEAFTIRSKNGWGGDATEFLITQHKTAIITTSMLAPYDLTPVNGPRRGYLRDGGFQEIDLETGELLFQWRWSDHWDITDAIRFPSGTEGSHEKPWDAFHINSVQKDTAGNYLVSSRHTNTVGYISRHGGEFIWKIGGKKNMFEDLSKGAATGLSMQHHARFLKENSTLTIFNNAVTPGTSDYQSKGLIIDIDVHAMTAKLRHEYLSPHKIGSESRGSMQILDNNHVLLGLGVNAGWSEFSKQGDVLCDVHFGPELGFGTEEVLSYRVLKRNWIGRPKTSPSIVYKGGDIYLSWNGATEVASWALLAADADIANYAPLGSVAKEGFETRIPVPTNLSTLSLRAVALDSQKNVLGFTSVLDLVEPVEPLIQAPILIQG